MKAVLSVDKLASHLAYKMVVQMATQWVEHLDVKMGDNLADQ
jgi:hypothetical protein